MKMLKEIPCDIYVHHIFPNLELPQILHLTNIHLDLVPYTKKYLIDWGRRIGMNINDHKQFMNHLRIKKDINICYEQMSDMIAMDLYSRVCTKNVNIGISKNEFLDKYFQEMSDLRPCFDYHLEKITHLINNKLFLRPEIYPKISFVSILTDMFWHFRKSLEEMIEKFSRYYFAKVYEGSQEYTEQLLCFGYIKMNVNRELYFMLF
jgi:hypothetical protein